MKPLIYILRKSIKNWLLQLKRKPVNLIAYIIFLILISLSLIFNKADNSKLKILEPELYNTIVGVLILVFTVPDLYSSINKGANFFRGADINLVFTSPTSPQKVLIYGFLKQIGSTFLGVFFILFQGPMLYRYSNIESYGIIVIMFGLFIMLIFNSILKILLYSIASNSKKDEYILKNIFKVLGIVIVAAYFIELYITRAPFKAITTLLNSSVISYIPVYGWIRAIMLTSMNGISVMFFVYTILIIAIGAICCYIIYFKELDFYEDVIASTELKETAIASTRTGETVFLRTGKKPKIRKVVYNKRGKLASAIFWRQILECKKTGFALINIGSVIYAIIAITAGLFSPVKELTIILGGMVYLLLIFSFTNKWQKDLSNPYIFMIPDYAFKKVIYSTVVDNIKNIVDGSIVFVITGMFFKSSPILIFINIIAFGSIGSLFIYGGVLTRKLLGGSNNLVFTAMMRMLILVLIIAPGIVLLITLYSSNGIIAYAVFIAYNLLFSGLIIFLGKGVFESIEL